MKTLLISLTLLVAGVFSASAQLTAATAFTSAPADVFPLLDKNTRLDMVDYFTGGLDTPSANRLNGRSAITALTPTSLTARLTDASTAQIVLLPAAGDTIIALVTTVATPGQDSNIKFFTSGWSPLATATYFTAPAWKDWIVPGHKEAEVTQYAPFMLASYVIDPAAGTLTATNNLATFLDKDIYSLISPALLPSITYTWTGKRFTK